MPATLKVTDLRAWLRATRTSELIAAMGFGAAEAVEQVFEGEATEGQVLALMQEIADEIDERIPNRGG